MTLRYVDQPLGAFLDLVATKQSAPGAGAAAAVTVSLAAGLVAMAARYSVDRLDGGADLVADAERLRANAADLADADAEAYGEVIAAYATRGDEELEHQLRAALTRATDVPLAIAELGADTARLAGRLATEGKRGLRGDAATAVLLAEAATRSAAHLVDVNVKAGGGDDQHVRRASDSVATAHEAAACIG
jgi:formiminotetrahydrofolate cyclodeaminase